MKAAAMLSRLIDHFAGRASEDRFQTVQHVSSEDAFVANEVRLQSAWIFVSVQVANTAHPNRLVFSTDAGDKGVLP